MDRTFSDGTFGSNTGLRTQAHQAAQDLKKQHSHPARDWSQVRGAAQADDEEGFQEAPHHQPEAQGQEDVCSEGRAATATWSEGLSRIGTFCNVFAAFLMLFGTATDERLFTQSSVFVCESSHTLVKHLLS